MPIGRTCLESFGISDIGLVRDHNEDSWMALPEKGLFLLADGMGGHSAGEVASKAAIDYFIELFDRWKHEKNMPTEEVRHSFEEILEKVNFHIFEEGQLDKELRGMGTTICALYFFDKKAILGHVGDSRIYRLRNLHLEQLTEDHTLVCEMLAIGAIKPEACKTFPYRHILTRAIGTHTKVEPTVTETDVQIGDLFMLCSDGLSNFVTYEQIADVLSENLSLQKKAQFLIDLANEEGGADNISIVLVEIV